jgi:hypothetical protein
MFFEIVAFEEPFFSGMMSFPMIHIRCQDCGAVIAAHLKHEHRCAQKSKPARKPITQPVPKTASSSSPSPSSRRIDPVRPPEPVRPPLSNVLDSAPAFDKRAYQRDYMRK